MEDNYVRCKFCGHKFAGGASRIKGHLSKFKGQGVRKCTQVSEDVQIKASLTFDHSNTGVKINGSSSNLGQSLSNLDSPSGTTKGMHQYTLIKPAIELRIIILTTNYNFSLVPSFRLKISLI